MTAGRARSNLRSVLGCAAAASVIAVTVVLVDRRAPSEPEPESGWRPPAGYALVDSVEVNDGRTLRLWLHPGGWYVERRGPDGHEASVGASGGGDRYTVSEILGGLVGRIPLVDTRAALVGAAGAAVRQEVHDGVFLVPATVAGPIDATVPVTPLDADGTPSTGEVTVPIAGRG
jgi:hypothetical protein